MPCIRCQAARTSRTAICQFQDWSNAITGWRTQPNSLGFAPQNSQITPRVDDSAYWTEFRKPLRRPIHGKSLGDSTQVNP